jgi:DNA polymerase-3 subunit epsilon
MSYPNAELEDLVRRLEESGDYKVLRRLTPREPTLTPASYSGKFGIMIDFETTGLDAARNEVIEVAMVKFRYSSSDEITGISEIFQSFNEPSRPIPAEIVELTGITDAMVAGHKIDGEALKTFVADAHIVIAHNAAFDRQFAERSWKFFEQKAWACSVTGIDWRKHGFDGSRLSYILSGAGFFHDAHRAIDDCHALVEILSRPLPTISRPAFAELMNRARRSTSRVWAQNSAFDLKDELKRRGYRWNDGSDGRPKSWYVDVDQAQRDDEVKYLRQDIYQREVDVLTQEITALNRFSMSAPFREVTF